MAFPFSLLALYFINAFYLTFPVTALGKWLFTVIAMPPATTNLYFTMAFLPWNIKPVYGFISDSLPIFGYKRKPYLILNLLGVSLCFLLTAFVIHNKTEAFVIKILESTFEAFCQLLLGIQLVDLYAGDLVQSGRVQSMVNGMKNFGSIGALLIGLPIYSNPDFNLTAVIASTSVIPLVGVLVVVFFFHEKRIQSRSADLQNGLAHELGSERTIRNTIVRPEKDLSIPGQELTFISVQSQDPMGSYEKAHPDDELRTSSVQTFPHVRDAHDTDADSIFTRKWCLKLKELTAGLKKVFPWMLFLCLANGLPNDSATWYQYTYSLFANNLVCLQYGSLVGTIGRLLACICYSELLAKKNLSTVFVISSVISVLSSLPKIWLSPVLFPIPQEYACSVLIIESFVSSFAKEIALLPLLVISTYYCPDKKRNGLYYSLFLSGLDLGVFAGGILSSLVVKMLRIEVEGNHNDSSKVVDWSRLHILIIISSIAQLLVVVMFPFFSWLQQRMLLQENGNQNVDAAAKSVQEDEGSSDDVGASMPYHIIDGYQATLDAACIGGSMPMQGHPGSLTTGNNNLSHSIHGCSIRSSRSEELPLLPPK